jgi:hypothetical protein
MSSPYLSVGGIRFLIHPFLLGGWAFVASSLLMFSTFHQTPPGFPRSAWLSCDQGGCPLYSGPLASQCTASRVCTPFYSPATWVSIFGRCSSVSAIFRMFTMYQSRSLIEDSLLFTGLIFPLLGSVVMTDLSLGFTPSFTPHHY